LTNNFKRIIFISVRIKLFLTEMGNMSDKGFSKNDPIRIMIADDHQIIRDGLEVLLNLISGFNVVGTASCGKEAILMYRKTKPDIVLMDIRMPNLTGIFATQMITTKEQNAKIIILSTYLDKEDILKAFQSGAKSYLLKDTPTKELEKIIRKVNSGKIHIPMEVALTLAKGIGYDQIKNSEISKLFANCLSNEDAIKLMRTNSKKDRSALFRMFSKIQKEIKNRIENGGYKDV